MMDLGDLDIQRLKDGIGPVFHRRYSVEIPKCASPPEELMRRLQSDLNRFSPQILARFEKTSGIPHLLRPGDEFMVHITGPWNGPVRVSDVSPRSLTLLTLAGHLEAGRIDFRIVPRGQGLRFEIESYARSKDKVVNFLYDKLPVARLAQTEMWESYCRSFADFASARDCGDFKVEVLTERRDEETGRWIKL